MFTKFNDEKVQTQELFRSIEKVSLTMDTWTTTNHITILRITIHWINVTRNLCERVLGVEELGKSYAGEQMAKVLHGVLIDYNLMDKVINYFLFLHNFSF